MQHNSPAAAKLEDFIRGLRMPVPKTGDELLSLVERAAKEGQLADLCAALQDALAKR